MTEEKNKEIFSENQTGLHQHLFKTHRRMMEKQGMIFGPFQGTTFTVITLNRESNSTCREKNQSPFHYDILTWYDLGCNDGTPHGRLLAYRRRPRSIGCVDRIHTNYHIGRKTSKWVYMVWGTADKKANNIQAWLLVARDVERHVRSSETRRKTKLDRSLTTPEDCAVFTWSSGCRVERKYVKSAEKIGSSDASTNARSGEERTRKLVALLMLPRQKTHASLKPTNLRESVWKELYTKIMETTLQGKESIHWATNILCTSLFLCPKQWKYQMRKQQWINN